MGKDPLLYDPFCALKFCEMRLNGLRKHGIRQGPVGIASDTVFAVEDVLDVHIHGESVFIPKSEKTDAV